MSEAEDKAKRFIETSAKIFWKNIEHELNDLEEVEGTKNSIFQKVLRGLLFLHYRIKALEQKQEKDND